MQSSSAPTKIQLPFAATGTKNTIPVPSQQGITPGAASFTDGFPPLTFTPLSAGGVPPAGADFNGIFNAISAIQQWQSAGGLFQYDAAFSTAVGGYPKGAVLLNSSGTGLWVCTTDNNTTNPDASGAGWLAFSPSSIQSGINSVAPDTGTTNAYAITLSPAPAALTPGMSVTLQNIKAINTGASTLNVNGLGALPIYGTGNAPLQGGELVAGSDAVFMLNHAGTAWMILPTFAQIMPSSIGIIHASSVAAVRNLSKTGPSRARTAAYYAGGLGGAGEYNYNPSDTSSADNGATIIVASDGGRWYLEDPSELSARQYGAYGDGAHDDSSALQAMFGNVLQVGAVIAAGTYLFGTAITQDNSGSSPAYPGVGAPSTRNGIRGESMANSILNFSGASGFGINLTGSTTAGTGQGIHALDTYEKFTVQCAAGNQSNSGIQLVNKAWWKLEDIIFSNLLYGLTLTACFSASIKTCYFNNNTYGINFQKNALGAPNSIAVEQCVFQSNSYAAVIGNAIGTNVVFRDCGFESCGTQGNANTGAIVATIDATAGFVGPVMIENGYFEGNAGSADINISNGSATLTLVVTIRNCLFQRISSTAYTTSNIAISTVGGPVIVLLEGNTFISAGTYSPSAARPFWSGPANCIFRDLGGNIYSETTSLPEPSKLAIAYPIAAAAFAGASGTASVANNCTITRNSTGNYTITFIVPPTSASYVPVVTMDRGGSGAMGYSVTAQTASSFTISCTNQAATATDPTNVWVSVM